MGKSTSIPPSTVDMMQWLFAAVFIVLICKAFFCVQHHQISAVETPIVTPVTVSDPVQAKSPAVSLEKKIAAIHNEKDDMVNKLAEKKIPSVRIKREEILYGTLIEQAADRHQVDPALVKAIIMAESGYNPKAISKKGAKGLMQLMPKTAEALGVEDSFNPEDNIDAGVEYFRKLLNRFDGDIELALAAYNAGSRKVRKHKGVPPYKATQYYIKKVLKYYQTYKEPMPAETGRT